MKKILSCILIALLFFSCKESSTDKLAVATSPVDSLVANWCNSWNNNDSSAVCNMFNSDAVFFDDGLIVLNAQELASKWVSPNIRAVKNLKSESLQQWSTNDRAGYFGKYELDIVVNDSVIGHPKGVFSVNWVKNENGDWKITSANIGVIPDRK